MRYLSSLTNSIKHRFLTRRRYYAIRWRRATQSKMHRRMVYRHRRMVNEGFNLRGFGGR